MADNEWLAWKKATGIDNPQYRERARNQALAWAQGRPYHEPINDECCPDFSCCYPDLFTEDEDARWRRYHRLYGRTN